MSNRFLIWHWRSNIPILDHKVASISNLVVLFSFSHYTFQLGLGRACSFGFQLLRISKEGKCCCYCNMLFSSVSVCIAFKFNFDHVDTFKKVLVACYINLESTVVNLSSVRIGLQMASGFYPKTRYCLSVYANI